MHAIFVPRRDRNTDHNGQIGPIFALAREYDIDMDVHYVCELTEKSGYDGRIAGGHVTKMSVALPDQIAEIIKQPGRHRHRPHRPFLMGRVKITRCAGAYCPPTD
jgi:hypothetical protein